jgi:SAM-dependent MidA family methyltransferase
MSWIHDEIRARGGAVRFRDFMELALYHPEHGYYTAGPVRTGREADFLTAPTASPWYGRVVARILSRLAQGVGPVRLVDVAAGDGALLGVVRDTVAADVVVETVAVERSEIRRRELEARMPGTVVVGAVAEVPVSSSPTVLHACELYDALPVHRVVARGAELQELWVAVEGDATFAWREHPAPPELGAYFDAHRIDLVDGQVAEASLAARETHRRLLSAAASDGVCLVLDYGYPAARLYDPRGRLGGSLTTFTRHRFGRDPFEAPGEQDLTAHVNWDDLRGAAADVGWHEVALLPLAELLVRGGLADELEARGLGMEAELDADTVAARQEVKRLLDPDGMGSDLKALVQATPDMAAPVRAALGLDSV